MKWRLRGYDSIFILLLAYLLVLQIQAIWPFTIDDMYISLRYAKNWAAGHGLLWNVQAPPVEGYSNFSFVALAALTLWLNGNPVVALKIAGVLGLVLTCCFLYLISRFWFAKRESLFPVFCLLVYKGQIIWAAAGLETAVYEALICGAVYCCLRGMGYQLFPQSRGLANPNFFMGAGFLLAVAGMTRPEAPALMVLFFMLLCFDRPKIALRHYWYGVFLFSLTILVFFTPYFGWRLVYFGYLFPNSVYCKGLVKSHTLSLDLAYLKLIWPFALFVIVACLRAQDRRHYFLWLPSLVYLFMLVDSDPIVAFNNRLFLPAFALLLPLAVQGMRVVVYGYLQRRNTVLVFYALVFLLVFFFIPAMTLADYRYFSQNPVKGEHLRAEVLDWLTIHTKPGEAVVLADSGMIPYYSNLNFIDSYCLNNVTMAHYPAAQRYEQFCKDVIQEKPAVIILTSLIEEGKVLYTPSDVCLKTWLNQQHDYKFQHVFVSTDSSSTYRYELFTH